MKKIVFIFIFIGSIFMQSVYAGNQKGTTKIGAYIGYPFGISFSHNFTQKDQLDIQISGIVGFPIKGNNAYFYYGGEFYVGYLRSVAEPIINGAVCPFEIGGGIGLAPVMEHTYPNSSQNLTIYIGGFFDLRWEVFFVNLPHFNLFLDISPGVYFNPTAFKYDRHLAIITGRIGLGLRYIF